MRPAQLKQLSPSDLLTDEQKESIRQANRANNRVERIYNFYAMLAGNDLKLDLHEALKRAEQAVDVWMEFDDANRISMYDMMDESRAFNGKMLEMIEAAKSASERKERRTKRASKA